MSEKESTSGLNDEIIVVDDTILSLKLLSDILEKTGYSVSTADSGELALQSIKLKQPSLILLDVMMPKMDGFEVCRRLKADEKTRDIPVIFISALDDEKSKMTGFHVGGVDYISKPFRKEEVLARVGAHIKLSRLQRELKEKNKKFEREILKRRQSEERYNVFINATVDPIFVKDDQFRYLMANDAMAKFFGKTKKELINKTDQELADEATVYPCQSSDRKALEVQGPFTIEEQLGNRIYEATKFPLLLKGNQKGIGGIMHDITEKKQSEKKIRSQNLRLNAIIEAMPDFIFISDREGNNLEFYNPKSKELLYPGKKFIGVNISDVFDAPTAELHIQKINECLERETLTSYEYSVMMNGKQKSYEARIVYLEENRVLRFVRDITKSKLAMESIRNERQLLRTLIDNLPVTIYVKDRECRKIIANKADVEVTGKVTEAEVLGKTDLEMYNDEIGQRGYNDDLMVIQSGEPVINREEVFFNKKGDQRWLLTSKIPLFDHHEKVTGLVGIGRDITEQKKAIGTIQKLSKGVEQSPSTIIITDIRGNIEYVNPKFSEITGYSSDEVIGKNPRILKSGEMPAERYKELWNIISSGGIWRGEFHNRKKNGELYWEWGTLTSIKNDNGQITNYIGIKEDISLRKQMESDLIVAKEKAEESDRLKSAFLANMSHEIRTPLNSIIGFSNLLGDGDFEIDQKQEFIHHIINSGDTLLNIINDIMDISKIESGELTVKNVPVHAETLIEEIRGRFEPRIKEKSLEIKIKLSGKEKDIFVYADPERLSQIFNNLIVNALKYTEQGSIQVGYETFGDYILFHVSDTGVGIPKEYHSAIFERFRQVEASYKRKQGGNGLGLAISKKLVEIMGGKIWVESIMGKGSTFYFTIPKK